MIREIVKYPTPLSLEFGGNVRCFDKELLTLVEDIKETMQHHQLEALSAYEVGSAQAVIVLQEENGEFRVLINPRVITQEGSQTNEESTPYFPLSTKVQRAETIKVMYEDIQAKQQFLTAHAKHAALIQQKIDYLFGATFLVRLSDTQRASFQSQLNKSCKSSANNATRNTFFGKLQYFFKN